jgi:hypothetical protein
MQIITKQLQKAINKKNIHLEYGAMYINIERGWDTLNEIFKFELTFLWKIWIILLKYSNFILLISSSVYL